MKIFEAKLSLREQINTFYQQQGYHSDWSDTERAFVCMEGSIIVGCVKVETIHKAAILRGMYVDSQYQRQGIGTRLLKHIEPILNQRLSYCMPLAHVANYYKKIRFIEVAESEYPEFLTLRCEKYRAAGYKIKTMLRQPSLF